MWLSLTSFRFLSLDEGDYDNDGVSGWSRRELRDDGGRVQQRPLHSWRFYDLQQWHEIQHKVRAIYKDNKDKVGHYFLYRYIIV